MLKILRITSKKLSNNDNSKRKQLTSIILFLYEKNKIINKLYNNFAEIYFTLCVIDKNLGNFLIKKEITDMNFRINYKLTMEIINTIKEFDFDEYTSFFDSKFNSLLEQFLSFNLKLTCNLFQT